MIDISKIKSAKLHGWNAQKKLSPPLRKKLTSAQIEALNPKNAAVLILIYKNNNEFYFPLIKRTNYNGPHANQISLPGGKYESADNDLQTTAIRETFEEIGVAINHNHIIKSLSSLYIPPSNFMVHPFLGYINTDVKFIKEDNEVDEILPISLPDFITTPIKATQINQKEAPYFLLHNHIVWGATAMIINELKELLQT